MSDVPTLSPKPSKRGVKITRSNSVPSPVSDRLKKRLSAPSMATSVPVTTTVTAQPVTKSPSTIHHVTFDPRPPASCTVESHWLRVTQHDQLTCDGDSSSSSATTLSASSDNMDDDDQDDDDDETDPGWPSLTCTSPHISRALSASNKKWYSDEWLDYWREGDDVERVERRVAIFEYPFGPPPYETESRRTTQPKVGPSPLSTSFEASPCRGTTSAMSCAVQNGGMFFPSFMGVGVPALKFSTD
ncbi:hypothetical protein BC829DRAFT_405240 [Chytridium lagenaria]|nr:hypothetical protein BC829DRAFT_405240 [Chytridium lagenaria]